MGGQSAGMTRGEVGEWHHALSTYCKHLSVRPRDRSSSYSLGISCVSVFLGWLAGLGKHRTV